MRVVPRGYRGALEGGPNVANQSFEKYGYLECLSSEVDMSYVHFKKTPCHHSQIFKASVVSLIRAHVFCRI